MAAVPADAVFLSCTNWPTLASLSVLASEQQRPTLSSNSALIWALARLAGEHGRLDGLGCLADLSIPAPAGVSG